MELAHRIAVMGAGKVRQLGAPREIYLRPTSRYVANFVGTMNEIPATVRSVEGGRLVVDTAAGQITGVAASDKLEIGGSAVASFRPEYCMVGAPTTDANVWGGIVETVLF